jgi:hypothetical protein
MTRINPYIAQTFVKTGMGRLVAGAGATSRPDKKIFAGGKASGRTFHPMTTHIPGTRSILLWVTSPFSLKMPNQPPSEALKSRLSMPVFATRRLTS